MEEIPVDYGKKKKSAPKESSMYKKIQDAAARLGYTLYRNQVGTYKIGNRWISSGLCVGASDLIGHSSNGRFVAVEVKLPGKKPTPVQQKFIDRVKYAGGIAGVVTSVDELIQLLKQN